VIATDGSLLDRAHPVRELFLSPGERVDLLLDLRGLEVGEELALKSLAFDPMHREHEMGGGMDHSEHATHGEMSQAEETHEGASPLGDGAEFYVLRMVVKDRVAHGGLVPEALSTTVPPADTHGAAVPGDALRGNGSGPDAVAHQRPDLRAGRVPHRGTKRR
jgi:blue copper oxidase